MDVAALIAQAQAEGSELRIVPELGTGIMHGTNGKVAMSVRNGGRLFKRKAIKGVGSPAARKVEWLVAELNGVRVYVCDNAIIVSTDDLNP